MKIINIIIIVISIAACNPSDQVGVNNVKESLNSDSAKEHWDKTGDKQTAAALNDLKKNTPDLVSIRQKEVITDEQLQPSQNIPVMDQKGIPQVEVRSNLDLQNYNGPLSITKIDDKVITGLIEGDREFNIFYSFPEHNLQRIAKEDIPLSLEYREHMQSGSLNRVVNLFYRNHPIIISIEEGSSQPYSRRFPDQNLAINQVLGKDGQANTVQVSFFNQSFTIAEGERIRAKGPNGEVEFFLLTSFARPASIMEEGQNHYIRLYGYSL